MGMPVNQHRHFENQLRMAVEKPELRENPLRRDVFRMHDSTDFRALYDAIWVELERQVREQKVDRPR